MTHEEEMALRELAAGTCTIQEVIDQFGPMSLWSSSGMKAEIQRAVEAEREACAKSLEDSAETATNFQAKVLIEWCATHIRARSGEEK